MIVDQAHTHHISPTRPHPGHQAPVASAPMLAPTPLQKQQQPPLTNDVNVNMEGSNSKDRIVESDEERNWYGMSNLQHLFIYSFYSFIQNRNIYYRQ